MYPTTGFTHRTEFEKECYKYGVDPQAEAEARRYGHDITPLENAKMESDRQEDLQQQQELRRG